MENEKYTAIYTDNWMAGSHMHTIVRFTRFEKLPNESMMDALKRLYIEDCCVYVFVGHPLLKGEESGV